MKSKRSTFFFLGHLVVHTIKKNTRIYCCVTTIYKWKFDDFCAGSDALFETEFTYYVIHWETQNLRWSYTKKFFSVFLKMLRFYYIRLLHTST